ncbi:MAG: hypothetical protein WB770_11490 [Acidimicrobiales bacterium]
MKEPRARVRLPRRIEPGVRPRAVAGSGLTCLVLFAGATEWIGVDVSSGAVLRSRPDEAQKFVHAQTSDGYLKVTRFDVVTVSLAGDDETIDPARPEAISITDAPVYVGRPRLRPVRRLLRELASPERPGTSLLSSWGPSIAYTDLDGSHQSVAIVETSPRQLALSARVDGTVVASVEWSGISQEVPIIDPLAVRALGNSSGPLSKGPLVEALGFRPSYLICALGRVREGHAPKMVAAVLPRRIPGRGKKQVRALLREGPGGEILGHRPAERDESVTP